MQLHENSARLSNASKVLVYKYINIKKQRFVKLLLFLHFIATGKFELLGILGTFKMAEHWYPNSPLNTLFAFVVLTLFKLPDPEASIYNNIAVLKTHYTKVSML